MAKRKTFLKLTGFLLNIYLIVFPFGRLLSFNFNFGVRQLPVNASDMVAVLFFISYVLFVFKFNKLTRYFLSFILFCLFSDILFAVRFGIQNSYIGLLYLLRITSYYFMFLCLKEYLNNKEREKTIILKKLTISVIFVAIFGWIQYFLYPDFRNFTIWGWDDHLYRMVGTFLDPTFTAIILAMGAVALFYLIQRYKKLKYILGFLLVILALLFTYSRAGYLAFFAGFITFLFFSKKIKISAVAFIIFVAAVILLPRPSSEGVKLERLHSIYAKLKDYKQSLVIIKSDPVFGVGYNNLCFIKSKVFNISNLDSHSCSGMDSSILFLISTTGIAGFMVFLKFLKVLIKNVRNDSMGFLFISSLAALFVHSLFANSAFYPWVLGYMATLSSLCFKEYKKR